MVISDSDTTPDDRFGVPSPVPIRDNVSACNAGNPPVGTRKKRCGDIPGSPNVGIGAALDYSPNSNDTDLQKLIQIPSFSDIVGLEDVKQAVKEVVILPMQRPDLFVTRQPLKGVLLHGPSGCGMF